MLKCFDCKENKKISKGLITPGGKHKYIITCKKECICFEIVFDATISELPCWKVNNNVK